MHPFCHIPDLTISGQISSRQAFLISNLSYIRQILVRDWLLQPEEIIFLGNDADILLHQKIASLSDKEKNEIQCTLLGLEPMDGGFTDCFFTTTTDFFPELAEGGLFREIRRKKGPEGWLFMFIFGSRLGNTMDLNHLLESDASLFVWLGDSERERLSEDLLGGWRFDDFHFDDDLLDLSKRLAGTKACAFSKS